MNRSIKNDPLRLDLEKTSYGYLLQSPTETGSNTAECLGLYLIEFVYLQGRKFYNFSEQPDLEINQCHKEKSFLVSGQNVSVPVSLHCLLSMCFATYPSEV